LRWAFAALGYFALISAGLTDGSAHLAAVTAVHTVGARAGHDLPKDELRSVWIWFALFGWAYLNRSHENLGLAEAVPANAFFKGLYPLFQRTTAVDLSEQSPWRPTELENERAVNVVLDEYDFHRLGRSILAIVFTLGGGTLGRLFFATKQPTGKSESRRRFTA
jgi:hypothetical protein